MNSLGIRGAHNSWICDEIADLPPVASPGDNCFVLEDCSERRWCGGQWLNLTPTGFATPADVAAALDGYYTAAEVDAALSAIEGGEAFPVGSIFVATVATNPAQLLGYGTWAAFGEGRVLVGLDATDADFDTAEGTGGAKLVPSAGANAAEAAHTHAVTSNVSVAGHAAHTHDYTAVPNHTHAVTVTDPGHAHGQQYRNTGTAGTAGHQGASTANNATVGTTATATTGITATTANPAGGVATGTTGGPSSALAHAVTNNEVTSAAGSAHTHTFTGSPASVVQPYVTVHFWKRTA